MNLSLSLSASHNLELRPELHVGNYLLPLCRIVGLMNKKGEITADEVRDAIADFRSKHPSEELSDRVYDVYKPEIKTPKQAVAYWTRSVNTAPVRVASLCLNREVYGDDRDVLMAAMTVVNNLISLYSKTLPLLESQAHTKRGRIALAKAKSLCDTLITASYDSNREFIDSIGKEEKK